MILAVPMIPGYQQNRHRGAAEEAVGYNDIVGPASAASQATKESISRSLESATAVSDHNDAYQHVLEQTR